MEKFRLDGQAAIVTGAGHGIGRATALALSKQGAYVTVSDIDEKSAQGVTNEITDMGGKAICCPCDVGSLDDIRRVIETTIKAFGKIDILINNAAIGGGGKKLQDITYEEWNRLINLDLTSVFMFSKEVIPYMMKQCRGKIVNISSGAGVTGTAGSSHYCSAKAGLLGLTKALAKEFAPYRINVNAVGVGLTDTRMSRARGLEAQIPSVLWPRIGQPEDQANAIVYMVSDEAEYMTGQVICPNGGAWM